MGYTSFTKELVEKVIKTYNPKSVMDLGAQNDFSGPGLPAPYISEWYEWKDIRYMCIDLNGENKAYALDLSEPLPEDFIEYRVEKGELGATEPFVFSRMVDMVCDMGTSEHVGKDGKFAWEAIYNCWLNKWNLLKVGGVMVNENPKSKNWIGHGFNYLEIDFYSKLATICDIEIIEIGEHAACHNYTDGWNIFCVLVKKGEKFCSLNEFEELPIFTK